MERLTEFHSGIWGMSTKAVEKGYGRYSVFSKLAEFEDLGVTPEQIREIDKLYAEKCRELADLKEDISQLNNDCAGLWQENELFKAEIENLKESIKAEENGLILRMPCKVGDTVWVITSPFNVFDDIEYDEDMKDEVYEAFISSATFYKSGEQYRIYAKTTNNFIGAYFRKCDFGEAVFLTREEAEAKLKEMEGGHE